MATHREVLAYLRPDGGYVSTDTNYDSISFEPQCEPFTKAEYEAAFDLVDAAKVQEALELEAKKEAALAKLEALGLDVEDLKALGLG